MSDTPTPATTEESAAAPQKKSKLFLIIGLVALLLAGGGAYWFFIHRPKAAAAKEHEEGKKDHSGAKEEGKEKESESDAKEEKKAKKKSHDEDGHGDEAHGEDEHGEEESEEEEEPESRKSGKGFRFTPPNDKEVHHIVELQPFIVNLADTEGVYYLRMSVSVGIGETKEEKPSALFITRVRNAILAVLTTKESKDVLTPEGKAGLRKELLKAVRKAVAEPEVHAVYITDLIVQL